MMGEQEAQHRTIDITEVFDTTPERLFKAWTNEKDFAGWFGPEGFETTFCSLDVSEGGSWRTCIADKSGDEYWMEGKYIEIIEGEKLVFTFNDGSRHKKADEETIVTILFSRSGDQTIMHFRQAVFKTPVLRDNHNKGWTSGFVCLHYYITNQNNGNNKNLEAGK